MLSYSPLKPYVSNNLKKYKTKHTSKINILVVLKYKTNKELFKISSIISSFLTNKFNFQLNDEIIISKYTEYFK